MLSALSLASCKFSDLLGGKEETTEIVFVDDFDIPAVRIGVEYNFEPYFTKEKGNFIVIGKPLRNKNYNHSFSY